MLKGFETSPRGRLTMACGTGKTLVGLWVARDLRAERTLVLLPSLSLLAQTYREWCQHDDSAEPFAALFVCSDQTVASRAGEADAVVMSTRDLPLPATTKAQDIRNFLAAPGRRVIFSTYQSSPEIALAMQTGEGPAPAPFDLVLADEAHRCVGLTSTAFGTVLDEAKIPSKRRLFMTATERVITTQTRTVHQEAGWDTASMDDAALFGPRFHQLTFGQAIDAGLLTDYQVVLLVIDDAEVRAHVQHGQPTDGTTRRQARSLAQQLALAKLMRDPAYDLRRVVTFHSRVASAQAFARAYPVTVASLAEADRPSGVIQAHCVTGEMTAGERMRLLNELRDLPAGARGVLSNARCLTEGIDVPSLDGVAFLDPRSSQVDIVQAVGRAIRRDRAGHKRVGTILVPVVLSTDMDHEAVLESSAFEPVWRVLRALRLHDEVLALELDLSARAFGASNGHAVVPSPSKVTIVLPAHVDGAALTRFNEKIAVRIVQETTASFEYSLGQLEAYKATHGHINVPGRYTAPGTGFRLGSWLNNRRTDYGRGRLSEARIKALDALGVAWDQRDADFAEALSSLRAYKAKYGHADVPGLYRAPETGFRLGRWLSHLKVEYGRGNLSADRAAALQAVGVTWDTIEGKFSKGLQLLKTYKTSHGHVDVPYDYEDPVTKFRLGEWLYRHRALVRAASETPKGHRNPRFDRRAEALSALGVTWDQRPLDVAFAEGIAALKAYRTKYRHVNVPQRYIVPGSHFALGTWLSNRRVEWRKSDCLEEQLAKEGRAPSKAQQKARARTLKRIAALRALGVTKEPRKSGSRRAA